MVCQFAVRLAVRAGCLLTGEAGYPISSPPVPVHTVFCCLSPDRGIGQRHISISRVEGAMVRLQTVLRLALQVMFPGFLACKPCTPYFKAAM
jgi:hypothetical protein